MPLILVVDDEPDMRYALSTVLKSEGHSIVEAGDGETALDELGRRPVELMLLDIRLPGMDGVQILRKVRTTRTDLPIIMVTGYGSVDTAVKLMQLGADAYLSKPFSNRQLVETVERVLQVRRLATHSLHRGLAEKLSVGRFPEAVGQAIPSPKRAPRLWAWATALILAVAAGGAMLHWTRERASLVPVPFSNPTALAWEGDKLWVADWVSQTVHVMEADGSGLKRSRTIDLAGPQVTGFAVAGQTVYVLDALGRRIQRRRADEKLTLEAEVASPGPLPSCLYWDGRYLWSCDSSEKRIYQHEPDEALTVLATFPSPGAAPVALFKDQDFLWSADAETRLLYRHRLDPQLSVLEAYSLPALDEGSEPVSAAAYRDGRWWIGRDGRSALVRAPASAFKKKR